MINNKPNVLLMGLFDTAIMTARCFKGTGVSIFGMDYQENHIGFFSNSILSIKTPDPRKDEALWLNFVLCWLEKFECKSVLIPTSDEFVILCSTYRKVLSKNCLTVFPEPHVLNTIIERDLQFNSIISCGIKVPTFLVRDVNLLNLSNKGIRFPFAIKPLNVIEWKRFFNRKGFVINNENDLNNANKILSQKPQSHFLIQTVIEGDNTSNFEVNSLFLPDGKLFMHTIRKIRQYPDRYGTATCIESVSNPEVELLAEKIIRNLNLYGFTNIEFKYNASDGLYYYIETNTRVWLQVNFSMKLGINFPLMYYQYLTSTCAIEKPEIIKHGKWVDFLPDLLFFKKHRKKYSLSIFSFIKSWLPILSTGLFSINDPMPFLKDLSLHKRIKTIFKM